MKRVFVAVAGALLVPVLSAQAQELKPLDSAAATLLQSGGVPTPAALQPQPQLQRSAPLAMTSSLPSGSRLSVAMERFVRERGWDIRWNIDEDYVLDAQLPIPTSDVLEAVTWIVHTYQSQGGMPGVVPRFARANKVVVIEKMDVRDSL